MSLPDVPGDQHVKRSALSRGVAGEAGRGILDPDDSVTEAIEGLRVLGGDLGRGERGGEVRAGRCGREQRQPVAGQADGDADQGFLGEIHVRHGFDGGEGGAVMGGLLTTARGSAALCGKEPARSRTSDRPPQPSGRAAARGDQGSRVQQGRRR